MIDRIKRYLPVITLILGMAAGSFVTTIISGSVALNDIKYLKERMTVVEGLLRQMAQSE